MKRALGVAAALLGGLGVAGACGHAAVKREEPGLHAPCRSDQDCLGDQLCTEVPGGRTCEVSCEASGCPGSLVCGKDKLCHEPSDAGYPGWADGGF